MDDETPRDAGLRHPADPTAQVQAAREQTIERLHDEVDTADIDAEPQEPEDQLDLSSQERLFNLANRRIPHA